MENLSQNSYVTILKDFDFAKHNLHRREYLINQFSRLKSSIPFSPRLNLWIEKWFSDHKSLFIFTDKDDFNGLNIQETLQLHIERFKSTNTILIWNGASSDNIYGSLAGNLMFRSWHDYIHITHRSGFSFAGESIVASIQCSMIPSEWSLEKELIMIEILGQNQYYSVHKEFLKNQRQFTIDYLKDPSKAIFTKQV